MNKCIDIQEDHLHDFVFIRGGEFRIDLTRIKLNNFYMQKTPVTQSQWKSVMENNPSYFSGDTNPVERVSFYDAKEFIKKLNLNLDLKLSEEYYGFKFRLPTEAEWEYAARGGVLEKISHKESVLDYITWYRKNSEFKTYPVMQKKPNLLGLFDMFGNVYEWCSDYYEYDYFHKKHKTIKNNPTGPSCCRQHVVRGGAYDLNADPLRCTYRLGLNPSYRYTSVGFRCVLAKPE